ncbi:MAG: Rrf2 family transcriptional regulator [bacterium]
MKISNKFIYAVKALVHMAMQKSSEYISIKDISLYQNTSLKYLEAIMVQLRFANIVKSIKGSKGGYKLSKSSEEISLYDIYKIFERTDENSNYIEKIRKADNSLDSLITETLKKVDESFYKALKCVTIKELVEAQEKKLLIKNPIYYI